MGFQGLIFGGGKMSGGMIDGVVIVAAAKWADLTLENGCLERKKSAWGLFQLTVSTFRGVRTCADSTNSNRQA